MTESELETRISEVDTAIGNMLLTGQKYEVGTGPSRRVFEAADLKELRAYRNELSIQLADVQEKSGLVGGF